MNTEKVLFFLNVLRRETRGHEQEINAMYLDAVRSDPDVIALEQYLSDYNFYPEIGKAMAKGARSLLDRAQDAPEHIRQTLQAIRQQRETIEHEIARCSRRMRDPEPFTDTITVLPAKDVPAYRSALQQIAGTCVYLIALYADWDTARQLPYININGVGIQDLLNRVNTRFLPKLTAIRRPAYSWVIRRQKLGGHALLDGVGFSLSYMPCHEVDALCASLRKVPIGTHAFLNTDAYASGELGVPYCWGTGNLFSGTPANAWALLGQDVVTQVRCPTPEDYARPLPEPARVLLILADARPYCVSPDVLNTAMNRWSAGYEIGKRRQQQMCLFCGKHVPEGKLVCASHFTSELN